MHFTFYQEWKHHSEENGLRNYSVLYIYKYKKNAIIIIMFVSLFTLKQFYIMAISLVIFENII